MNNHIILLIFLKENLFKKHIKVFVKFNLEEYIN